MLFTAELRWFMPDRPEPAVLDWFEAHGTVREESRVDEYLSLPGVDGVGVKLRQGLLEIKARRGAACRVTPATGVTGWLERWVKVSRPEAAAHWADARWIATLKERSTRRLALSGEPADDTALGDLRTSGCNFELTVLSCEGVEAWTIGFEAFGPPRGLEDAVVEIAGRILTGASGVVSLTADMSLGYPAWLSRSIESEAPCP